jgi:hypothetical protein
VLRPGDTLTMNVVLGDPAGGAVTISTQPTGSPNATWTSLNNGTPTATATFTFSPQFSDEGVNYPITLLENNSDGTGIQNTWNVYVPTADEQQVYISEFLANPTTNTSSSYFNPLKRAADTESITAWDQYVEVANLSPDSLSFYRWQINNGSGNQYVDQGDTLGSSNSIVIYGGGDVGDPNPPSIPNSFPANQGDPASSSSLALATSGQGVIALYNNLGNLVDRVVYNASQLSSNGSWSRFPTLDSGLVPQSWISTNWTTAGLQYNGAAWSVSNSLPYGVTNLAIEAGLSNTVDLSFEANTSQASTLWATPTLSTPFPIVNQLSTPFQVIGGKTFTSTNGSFTVTNSGAEDEFFIITTQ